MEKEFSPEQFAAFRKISVQLVTLAEKNVDRLQTIWATRRQVQLFDKSYQVAMIAQLGDIVKIVSQMLAREASEAAQRGRGDEQIVADLHEQAALLGQAYGCLKDIQNRLGASR